MLLNKSWDLIVDSSLLWFHLHSCIKLVDNEHKIIVAITGASGSIYAKVLLDQLVVLKDQIDAVGIVMSKNAKDVWEFELEKTVIKTTF